jgi:hypothetical protein
MAVANKVFVSPGVYTSEFDLSFVAQSVGVTTLGVVGETQIGPAFEPIFITNYSDFESYFGGTIPEKFTNTQIPKYELAYIAKSYLQQSNQLFVTRVLGLSGYDAGPSWTLTTIANVDGSTVGLNGTETPFTVNFTGTTGSTTMGFLTSFPANIQNNLDTPFTQFDGSTSTLRTQINAQLYAILLNNSLSGTSAYYFGTIATDDYNNISTTYTAETNVYQVSGLSESVADYTASVDDTWYYANFNISSGDNYTGYSWYNVVSTLTGASGTYSGTVSGTVYNYTGTAYTQYNNLVAATLRSRGIANYVNDNGPVYTVSGLTSVIVDDSGTYSAITQNPFASFAISGQTAAGNNFSFQTSLSQTDANYISKVFGQSNFGKLRAEVPLFVEETFPNLLNYAYNKGYIREWFNCTTRFKICKYY